MDLIDIAVSMFFGIWFLLTLINHLPLHHQPRLLQQYLHTYSSTWMLPMWNFFAPNSGSETYVLLYRDSDASGLWSQWYKVTLSLGRSRYCAFWNPGKTTSKALHDIMSEIFQVAHNATPEMKQLQFCFPYLLLLEFVSRQRHTPSADRTQFVMLRHSRQIAYRIALVSNVHRMEAAGSE